MEITGTAVVKVNFTVCFECKYRHWSESGGFFFFFFLPAQHSSFRIRVSPNVWKKQSLNLRGLTPLMFMMCSCHCPMRCLVGGLTRVTQELSSFHVVGVTFPGSLSLVHPAWRWGSRNMTKNSAVLMGQTLRWHTLFLAPSITQNSVREPPASCKTNRECSLLCLKDGRSLLSLPSLRSLDKIVPQGICVFLDKWWTQPKQGYSESPSFSIFWILSKVTKKWKTFWGCFILMIVPCNNHSFVSARGIPLPL